MVRLTALWFVLPLLAAPAAAQGIDRSGGSPFDKLSRMTGDPPVSISRPGFSFPVVEYREPDGTITVRKGVIASKEVAPGTLLGIGLFEFAPKMQPGYSPDQSTVTPPKRKRRAAIGLSVKF